MIRTKKTEAIVLKKKQLLNQDLLMTLFTHEFGKIQVFAKGVKKITSKRAAHLQTANLIRALFSKKSDRWYLQATDLVSGFVKIRGSGEKVRLIQFFLFLIDRLLPEEQKEQKIFSLTKQLLIDLSQEKSFGELHIIAYSNKLLSMLGYIKEDKRNLPELLTEIESIIDEKPVSFKI